MSVCLHVFLTTATQESRFLREAASLLRSGLFSEVQLAAKWEPNLPEREELAPDVAVWRVRMRTVGLPKSLPFQLLKHAEWKARIVRHARKLAPRLVVAHSLSALPTAVACKRQTDARLIYDAHELETERNGQTGMRKWVEKRMERRLIRECDAVLCVSDGIADWYARTYGIARPTVVRNVPDVQGAPPSADPRLWRDRFGIPAGHVVFIYQGGLFAGRRIEQLIRVFGQARPDRHVVFMGYGEREGEVRAAARRHTNIHYAPAVPPGEVLRHTAGADVGLVGVENVCLSYYYSLPNKLFEYLHAGLPVMMPDFPEMRRVAEHAGCGWVVGESDAEWLAAVNGTGWEQIRPHQTQARAAAAMFSWQEEEARLILLVRAVLEAPRAAVNAGACLGAA